MTTLRIVALLLVANTAVFVVGALGGASSHGIQRPIWLPPLWIRTAIPLAVAGGLWFEQRWAWWIAVAMCAGLLLWIGVASFVLALGATSLKRAQCCEPCILACWSLHGWRRWGYSSPARVGP